MISDESSSDSETGRFKSSQAEKKVENRNVKEESFRSTGRGRPENDRFRRDFDRRRDDRDHNRRHDRGQTRERPERPAREPYRPPRHSPPRRRHSRERERSRDKSRRSHDRHNKPFEDPRPVAPRENRSSSKDKKRLPPPPQPSRAKKSPGPRRDFKEEIKQSIKPQSSREDSYRKHDRARSRSSRGSSSPDIRSKRSIVQKATHVEPRKPVKAESPIDVDKHPSSEEEVQAGSYYDMKPAVIKEKSVEKEVTEESSEIDSSDDERLRAKLLNLERELSKTRKKKHKKKHKRKSSKSKNDKDKETSAHVEVTSTTDLEEKNIPDIADKEPDIVEVTSTQKSAQKDSSEEGEITSDNDSQSIDIDPTDLRHKLKRTVPKADTGGSPDLRERLKSKADVCGPALPPHFDKTVAKSVTSDTEGPALPPHLKKEISRNIGEHFLSYSLAFVL